jgi:hypothetical protein
LIGGSITLHKKHPHHQPPPIDPEDLPELCPGVPPEEPPPPPPPICPLVNQQGECVCPPGFVRNENDECVPDCVRDPVTGECLFQE